MSDLTKRLRSLVTFAHSDFTVAEEAADEIERLQRDNLKHEAALAADHLTIERLTAELAAAKAGLENCELKRLHGLNDDWQPIDAAITDKQEPLLHSERKP